MKVCFFLQRRWAMIGHAMATHIKELHPETEFCAFVGMRPSLDFLKSQKDIDYTALLLEEDIHKRIKDEVIDYEYLARIEKEYGIPNLWPHLYVDRVIMNGQLVREYPFNHPSLSYEDILLRVQVTAKAIIAFLDKEKPDALVISVIGSVGSSLLYFIAKKRGIQCITLELARIGNKMVFSEDYKNFTWVKKYFEEISTGRVSPEAEAAKEYVVQFRDRPMPYRKEAAPTFNNQALRKANIEFLKPEKLIKSIVWHSKTLLSDLRKDDRDYTDVLIWWLMWDKLKRKTRGLIGYSDLYSDIQANENYAYFPLHYDPEMSTLLYAPYYTDQAQVVKAVARALPIDMFLYVKEHPGMVGYRTRDFYKEILKVPNIKLIRPDLNGSELLKNTKITLTITGSGGWESILLKKPVITFGDVFYNDVPGVKRCRGYEELPYLIKEQLQDWKHNEKSLVDFVSALLEESIPGDYIHLWVNSDSYEEIRNDEGIKKLSEALTKKLDLQKNK
jgi:hypothetical protein